MTRDQLLFLITTWYAFVAPAIITAAILLGAMALYARVSHPRDHREKEDKGS